MNTVIYCSIAKVYCKKIIYELQKKEKDFGRKKGYSKMNAKKC